VRQHLRPPDPLRQKAWIIGLALAAACFFTTLSSLAQFSPTLFILATAFTGFFSGLVSAYGRWSLSFAMTCVLAFVFAMGQQFRDGSDALDHLVVYVCGALIYATYTVAMAWAFDDRIRRLLLAEAMRAFADYLRAKAALYNPDAQGPAAFRALIDAHAALADRLQAARDSLFARRRHPLQLKRIDTLIALLDAFETVLSSDADFEMLRRAPQREAMWQLNAFVHLMADEVEGLTLALRSRHATTTARTHSEEAAQLVGMVTAAAEASPQDPTVLALVATVNKLVLADSYVAALATTLDRATPPSNLAARLDLAAFQQNSRADLACCGGNCAPARPPSVTRCGWRWR